ncbi:MAG: outer membrane lipoprotein LolB [Gammaproteobacteria bacterium]|uniref:Outer-membrane lipoprotein LolB n=1 Tax=Candidatus Thiopontia autotrophica TaxID=2841688 RepID=A0A8J6TXV8_9GAMM|nr:outer membrane lipoprotein LolB [Candidatus Thiopontia autotrophica]MBL6968619.1 outer membrane lipoprotein LolB [Gammaproteobacteria bacterium]
MPERIQPVEVVAWEVRQQQLATLQEWSVDGRVAFRSGLDGGQSGFSWQHTAQSQRFDLTGILGAGSFSLKSGLSGVELTTGDGEIYRGEDPERLLFEISGWRFPVKEASYWVRGLPDPQFSALPMVLDKKNRLQLMAQSGWSVEIIRYQYVGELELPALVAMERGDVRVKLRLTNWKIG